jgi:hypothetical protein
MQREIQIVNRSPGNTALGLGEIHTISKGHDQDEHKGHHKAPRKRGQRCAGR